MAQYPERAGQPAPPSLVARRAEVDAFVEPPSLVGLASEHVDLGGIAALAFHPPEPKATVMYLHGGGYRLSSPERYARFAADLAGQTDCRVVVPRYRLAPEYPFPAGLNDALAAYAALTKTDSIIIAGDSAGGGLACSLTLALADSSDTCPAGLILISPWVDLRVQADSYDNRKTRDRVFSKQSALEAASLYLQGHSSYDPLVSPLLGNLAQFPPVLLFAGSEEVLLDDSIRLAKRLEAVSAEFDFRLVEGMQHVWPMLEPNLPQSLEAVDAMARFVSRIVSREARR